MNKILEAREEKANIIKNINFNIHNAIIIKANIPGINKKIKAAYILINLFYQYLINKFEIRKNIFYESNDGPYYILFVDKIELKAELMKIEETHPLGRFIDLDFYTNSNKSSSRSKEGLPLRKCIICDDIAYKCIREHKHQVSDIIGVIENKTYEYVLESLEEIIKEAIYLELNLEDKFGLVTPTSSGSHCDMDYNLMKKSIDVIVPRLIEMAKVGLVEEDIGLIYQKIKQIGIISENEMFLATRKVNTYKGLIFILGLIVSACGFWIGSKKSFDDIYNTIKLMTNDKFKEGKTNSFGEYAYLKYGFTGIRGEAQAGLPVVRTISEFLNGKEINDENLHMALIKAVELSFDTVLLKRSGSVENYQYYKELISSIKVYDIDLIKQVTKECVDNNISCGGAADILISALFINNFKRKFWYF